MKVSRKDIKKPTVNQDRTHFSHKIERENFLGEVEQKNEFIDEIVSRQRTQNIQSNSVELHGLLSELETLGNQLTQYSRLDDFHSYRRLVKTILQRSFPGTFFVENIVDGPRYRNPVVKEHKVVHLVNEELNSLMILIKNNHKSTLEITSKILEIRGLLIDLLT